MAVIELPSGLRVQRQDFGQKRFDLTLDAGDAGAGQARILAPPRWLCSLVAPSNNSVADAAEWRAMLVGLRGRVNQLAVYDLLNTAPAGTARGSWASTALAAAGATSIAMQSRRGLVNKLVRSEDFTATWSVTGTLKTADATTNPLNGATTADLVYENTATGQHYTEQAVTADANVPYVFSFYVKTAGRDVVMVQIYDWTATSNNLTFQVNASTGAIVSAPVANGSASLVAGVSGITAVGGGWFRVVLAGTPGPSTGGQVRPRISLVNGSTTYTGDGSSGVYLWGADLRLYSDWEADPAYQRVGATTADFDAVSYINAGRTIKKGDWFGINQSATNTRQLLHAQADVTLDATAAGTITFEPPLRASLASGSALSWDKPTCLMRVREQETRWTNTRPFQGSYALDLIESWEG